MKRLAWRRMAASAGLGLLVLAAVPYAVLSVVVQRHDFKVFAEEKASEFLKSRVHIGRIRAGFLNQITLSAMELDAETPEGSPYRIEVGQIVFRYAPLQLLGFNFKTPSAIFLKSPKLILNQNRFPYAFFEDIRFTPNAGRISSLELASGEVRYEIPALHKAVRLHNIRGRLKPAQDGKMGMELEAVLEGDFSGRLRVRGLVDAARKTHEVEIRFEDLKMSGSPFLAEQSLQGKIRWIGPDLYVDRLRTQSRGWQSEIEGNVRDLFGKPVLTLSWTSGQNAETLGLALKTDFAASRLEGQVRLPGLQDHAFSGALRWQDRQLFLQDLQSDWAVTGQGFLDFSSGRLRFDLEKEGRRLSVKGTVHQLEATARAEVHHVSVAGLDLVTSAALHLKPVEAGGEPWKFGGQYDTDYFILDFVPFEDFQGSFEISPSGLRNLTGSWGKVFDLKGEISLRPGAPVTSLVIAVKGFDLKNVRQFRAKPLPRTLSGMLEGKLKIEGAFKRPEVMGKFTIKDGALGKVSYDVGFIQFHGFPPYLALEDSRVLKGRTTLYLNGALDLSLKNMFHGVAIQTRDNLVVWNGWDLNLSSDEADQLEIQPGEKFPVLALRAHVPEENNTADTEDATQERYLTVGPKFKF